MIRTINAHELDFSKGNPKICVPVSGTSLEEMLWEVRDVKTGPADIIEWRVDFCNEDVISVLRKIKEEAESTPLLVTLRTKEEGGKREISREKYAEKLQEIILSGKANLIDIELSAGENIVKELTALAKERGVISVVSAHFFTSTPSKEEIIEMYAKMEALGADIPKVAAMPLLFTDVLTLMDAAFEASRTNFPLIAVSMGKLGRVTRICGAEIGSAITFASGKIASAPGQLNPKLLKEILTAK